MSVKNGAEMSAVTGFGATLRRWRRADGLTQEELAARSRVDQGTISAIEVGRSKPTMETVRRLAVALGRPVAEVAVEAGYLDAAERDPEDLPAPLVEAYGQMIRDHPELRPQLDGWHDHPERAGRIVDLATALGYVIKGWVDDLPRPDDGE
jgi:transcriptional regulator with XRE-family HTH domain